MVAELGILIVERCTFGQNLRLRILPFGDKPCRELETFYSLCLAKMEMGMGAQLPYLCPT